MTGIFFGIFCLFLISSIKCSERSSESERTNNQNCNNKLSKCWQRDPIFGGFTVNISEAPDQVALLKHDSHFCGGTILSRRTVLTAAHCVERYLESKIAIRAGSSFRSSGGLVVNVQKVIIHPKYTSELDYDFALLILDEVGERDFPDIVRHAKLPEKDYKIEVGQLMQISGWGSIANKFKKPEQLQAAKVPIYDFSECKNTYPSGWITKQMICAGYSEGKIDSCYGDSGGGLIRDSDHVIVGVTIFGIDCAIPGIPGVYARVDKVLDWIHENIKY